ncbi:hypothetical protein GCM10010389_20140 [Streptomyces echinoruber]|uniref:Uncharacterized protein n=1 Tax=Streptomyces echinoruber TaxID=68898 RepID=A0A918R180_9ACTN|nr:hypothetical protein GCM10010389_20140 [Streptomyces echinoruber]
MYEVGVVQQQPVGLAGDLVGDADVLLEGVRGRVAGAEGLDGIDVRGRFALSLLCEESDDLPAVTDERVPVPPCRLRPAGRHPHSGTAGVPPLPRHEALLMRTERRKASGESAETH